MLCPNILSFLRWQKESASDCLCNPKVATALACTDLNISGWHRDIGGVCESVWQTQAVYCRGRLRAEQRRDHPSTNASAGETRAFGMV